MNEKSGVCSVFLMACNAYGIAAGESPRPPRAARVQAFPIPYKASAYVSALNAAGAGLLVVTIGVVVKTIGVVVETIDSKVKTIDLIVKTIDLIVKTIDVDFPRYDGR
ncbi:MAG: hypothetical protein LBB61_05520 [Treponema sp.]|jgi:hypothetical protein|nr:hypothetical protein [Treponema sp.]